MRLLTGSALALFFLAAPLGTAFAAGSPAQIDEPQPIIAEEESALQVSESAAGVIPTPGFDFRNATWLMKRDAVRSSEDLPIISEDDRILTLLTNIQGLDVILGFFFGDDGLFEGGAYFFELGNGNTARQIAAYRMVRGFLSDKFGAPVESRLIWNDETFKGDADNWVKAVSLGHVDMEAFWAVGDTLIRHKLSSVGEDGFLHALNYAHAGRLAADNASLKK